MTRPASAVPRRPSRPAAVVATVVAGLLTACASAKPEATQPAVAPAVEEPAVTGSDWLRWRGPAQDGTSPETGLPGSLGPGESSHLWTLPLAGRGTPVIDGDRLYAMGYRGAGPDLSEVLVAVDAATGEPAWEYGFSDFLSDIIYERYSIGAPTVDPDTRHVFAMSSAGELGAFTRDGEPLWVVSMMEAFGRMTFPNGRTGSPVVVGDVVVVHGIVAGWGQTGPARDRFHAFDKESGRLRWVSTPGIGPTDSSFSTPVVVEHAGRVALVAGTGCGHVVAVSVDDGTPLWRTRLGLGGVNASPLVVGGRVYAIHGKENLDDSTIGRLVAFDPGDVVPNVGVTAPVDLPASAEIWRASIGHFTSSPVLGGGRLYQVTPTGELVALDPADGRELWRLKLGAEQLHASPTYADGKLYIPMKEGELFVVRPEASRGVIVSKAKLEGSCLGAPAIAHGRVYVHTTQALYAFGRSDPAGASLPWPATPRSHGLGPPARLLVEPAEVALEAGEHVILTARVVDAIGRPHGPAGPLRLVAPGELPVTLESDGSLGAAADARLAAGVVRVASGSLEGTLRVRVFPAPPWTLDFAKTPLKTTKAKAAASARPPSAWIGAGPKWAIRRYAGTKALVKTLDRVLFQRALSFVGKPGMRGYTVEAVVRSEGDRRGMGTVGVVVQRYVFALNGNWKRLEVVSNHDRVSHSVPFDWKADTWYHLKAEVIVDDDGSGTLRARAWKKGTPEPETWPLSWTHARAHREGAPGIFGFSPQSRYPVAVDRLTLTPRPMEAPAAARRPAP